MSPIVEFWHIHRERILLVAVLSLSSAMSVSLVAARIFYLRDIHHIGLIWNLFLAWIPLFIALGMWALVHRGYRSTFLLIGPFSVWFAFFPNAPYLVTDIIHLHPHYRIPLWYDATMLFSFAWNGLCAGLVSLWIIQNLAILQFGKWFSWLLVMVVVSASGFGVYLGRFLRWNSWDVITNPQLLLMDIVDRIINPLAHPRTYIFTLLFATLLFLAYATMTTLINAKWQHSFSPER